MKDTYRQLGIKNLLEDDISTMADSDKEISKFDWMLDAFIDSRLTHDDTARHEE